MTVTETLANELDREGVWDQVRAVQAGDTAAFSAIYRIYSGVVRSYVGQRIHDADLAEDVTSETFLRALRGIERVTDHGKDFGAWLVTIARNIIVDHAKTRWTRSTIVRFDVEPYTTPRPGLEGDVIERLTAAEIARYLQRLSQPQRQCLALRIFWQLPVEEAARTMHRTGRAVRALQYRAVRRLAEILADDNVLDLPLNRSM